MIYRRLEELQKDLDHWMEQYNNERVHQGKRCQGRTPMERRVGKREDLGCDEEEGGSDSCELARQHIPERTTVRLSSSHYRLTIVEIDRACHPPREGT